jgi:hypothetical protein
MVKLKINTIEDERPINLTVKLPASVHRDLVAYAEILKREGGQLNDPSALVAPMLARFMATDRAFKKIRGAAQRSASGEP